MSMHFKNYLKLTIFKISVLAPGFDHLNNFKLNYKFNSKSYESEKIQNKETEYSGGKCYYYEWSHFSNSDIVFTAFGTSWMAYNTNWCSWSISFDDKKFNDQKSKFTLINKSGDEVLTVTASIWCDYSMNNHNDTSLNNASFLNKTYNIINNKVLNNIDSSAYDIGNLWNNTANNIDNRVLNFNTGHCESNVSYWNIIDNSQLKPTISPTSDRYCMNNNDLSVQINASEWNLTTIKEYLINNKDNFSKEKYEKLENQIQMLKEKEENLQKWQHSNWEIKEKIKEKEHELTKEKNVLEEKIKTFKQNQSEFESKNQKLKQRVAAFEKKVNDYSVEQEIYENTQDIFFNINYFLMTNQDIPLNIDYNYIDAKAYSSPITECVSIININTKESEKQKRSKAIVSETLSKYRKELVLTSEKPKTLQTIEYAGSTRHEARTKLFTNTNNINNKSKKAPPPIAQINWGSLDYSTDNNEKSAIDNNRLLDSLDCNYSTNKGVLTTVNKDRISKKNNIAPLLTSKDKSTISTNVSLGWLKQTKYNNNAKEKASSSITNTVYKVHKNETIFNNVYKKNLQKTKNKK